MADTTVMNPLLEHEEGPVGRDSLTELNPQVQETVNDERLLTEELLFGKYRVKGSAISSSGEADLYLCEHENKTYIAKYYRRLGGIKPEVLPILKSIRSPYVAPIYEYGTHKGFPLEISEYYPNGSLQDKLAEGKRYTYEEIKRDLLPYINEALRVLHEKRVLHKDLKPSNLMLLPDGKGVSLIDFGISSLLEEYQSFTVTETGMTVVYSAPETYYLGIYYKGADYYSLGITLYALFCGAPPSSGKSKEDVYRDRTLNGITFPDEMPQELRDLIWALTFGDIHNRDNPDDPNRRWTYDEVKRFLDGEELLLPGYGKGGALSDEILPYGFNGKQYTSISALVYAMGEAWEKGVAELRACKLSAFFHLTDRRPQLANFCDEAESECTKNSRFADLIFWRLLYRLCPKMPAFFWKGRKYEKLSAFGSDMLDKLRTGDMSDRALWDSFLDQGMLSAFLSRQEQTVGGLNAKEIAILKKGVQDIESEHRLNEDGSRGQMVRYYLVAYLLSNRLQYKVNGVEFENLEKLSQYMTALYRESFEAFSSFCFCLVDRNGQLDVQLEAWLIAQKKQEALNSFRARARS